MLDTFHKNGKRKVPVNRHRIPAVGDMPEKPEKRRLSGSPGQYEWNYDGHRQKKQKGQTRQIDSIIKKVDLPSIEKPGNTSPKRKPRAPPGQKFVKQNDARAKKIQGDLPPPPDGGHGSNDQLSLIDIDISTGKPKPPGH